MDARVVAPRAATCAALMLAIAGTAVAALPAGPPGRLVQARGKAGCLQYAGSQQCARPRSLRQPEPAAVSRDGRFVYIPGTRDSAITIFARNRATGGLRQLRGGAAASAISAWAAARAPARSYGRSASR